MRTARLSWMLLRAGGRSSVSMIAMAVVCSAVSTALLLFVVGGYDALTGRATVTQWRTPQAAGPADAAAVMATAVQSVQARPLTVVDIAVLPGGRVAAPPGLPHVPRPGEVWVSPALGRLLDDLPADRLADRLLTPGRSVAGTIDEASLIGADELLAVVGRSPDDPAMDVDAGNLVGGADVMSPTLVSGIGSDAGTGSGADELATGADLYRGLALCALALLVIPLTTLGAAAARLGVSRRDQRLAAMRLVGASSWQVTLLTAAEALLAAVVGVVVGVGLHAAVLAPIGTRISLQQNAFTWSQVWPTGWHLPAVPVAVVLLGVAGAVLGLRRVRISPLGVAQRVTPPGVKALRAVVLVVVFVAWTAVGSRAFGAGLAVVAASTFVVIGTISLVGPWVVWMIGRLTVARSDDPATLLAGRRLMDDPKGAWRTVGALALVGFVATGLAVFPALGAATSAQESSTVRLELPAGADADAAATEVENRLAAADLTADVTIAPGSYGSTADGEPLETVVAGVAAGAATPAQLDLAVTALTGLVPGAAVRSSADETAVDARVLDDIGTGSIITLAVVFVVAAVTAGLSQASTVLDTRRQLQLLTLAGTPTSVLRRARRRQVLTPLLATLSLSVGLGLAFVAPLGGVQLVRQPQGLVMLATCLVLGVTAVALAVEASTPLLQRVSSRVPEAVG